MKARKHVHSRLQTLMKGTRFRSGTNEKLIVATSGQTHIATYMENIAITKNIKPSFLSTYLVGGQELFADFVLRLLDRFALQQRHVKVERCHGEWSIGSLLDDCLYIIIQESLDL